MAHAEAIEALRAGFAEGVADAVRELLERKHLYQSVRALLDEAFISECASEGPSERKDFVVASGQALLVAP